MRPVELIQEIERRGVAMTPFRDAAGSKRVRVSDVGKLTDLVPLLKQDGEYRDDLYWWLEALRAARALDECAAIGEVGQWETPDPVYCVGHPDREAHQHLHDGANLCWDCWIAYLARSLGAEERAMTQGALFDDAG